VAPPADLDALVRGRHAVQVDGHHPQLAEAALACARSHGGTTVLDGGSWKPGTEALLPLVDVAACSADFHPPGTSTPSQVAAVLYEQGVRWIAITRGAEPVLWWRDGRLVELPVAPGPVVDTLGAGDVFHGALTHGVAATVAAGGRLDAGTFPRLLAAAAAEATRACGSFGTRAWMADPAGSLSAAP
jgi:sugar/nucleoside kinase (ribokinase family)